MIVRSMGLAPTANMETGACMILTETMTDQGLLQAFVAKRSTDAFRMLVERYVGLVVSACQRQLHDRHLAEDATQAVFILLAQKAGSIRSERLGGWLLSVARYACNDVKRERARRARRERTVAMPEVAVETEHEAELQEL